MNAFETFLGQLAQVLDFTALRPDQHGACLIVVKSSDTPLLFELDDHIAATTILLSSPIGTYPQQKALAELCLKGNLSIQETLSYRTEDQNVYLHRRLNPHIQTTELKQVIDSFLKQLELWKTQLETLPAPEKRHHPLPPSSFKA